MNKVQGEYVDTAGHGGQSTDDGGKNAEATCTEQKVLQKICVKKKMNPTRRVFSFVFVFFGAS